MSVITETEIKSMTKEQNYMQGYKDGKNDVLDKIRAEMEQAKTEIMSTEFAGNSAYRFYNKGLQKALSIIDNHIQKGEGDTYKYLLHGAEILVKENPEAIEALQDIPTMYYPQVEGVTPTVVSTKTLACEDVIRRQVVKEQMIKYGFHAPDMTVTEFVEDLPPANP